MSGDTLQRMPCPNCGKKIKFGPEDVGSDAFCPHCDTPVVLRAPGVSPAPPPKPTDGTSKKQLIAIPSIIFAVVFSLITGIGLLKRGKGAKQAKAEIENMSDEDWLKAKKSNKPTANGTAKKKGKQVALLRGYKRPLEKFVQKKVIWGNPTKRKSGSPVQLMGHKIDKAETGNLTYVVGLVQNHTGGQLYNVEAFFDLYDGKGKKVGDTKDYFGILAPKGKWELRATIFQRGVTSAKLRDIKYEAE
jgi:hypothetical protein